MGGITKAIGGVGGVSNSVSSVMRGMDISSAMQAALHGIAESGDQRAAFNGILLASAANVMKKPNFNLEVEINDLMIRLGNLRGMQSQSPMGALGSPAGVLGNLFSILGSLDSAAQALVKNVK